MGISGVIFMALVATATCCSIHPIEQGNKLPVQDPTPGFESPGIIPIGGGQQKPGVGGGNKLPVEGISILPFPTEQEHISILPVPVDQGDISILPVPVEQGDISILPVPVDQGDISILPVPVDQGDISILPVPVDQGDISILPVPVEQGDISILPIGGGQQKPGVGGGHKLPVEEISILPLPTEQEHISILPVPVDQGDISILPVPVDQGDISILPFPTEQEEIAILPIGGGQQKPGVGEGNNKLPECGNNHPEIAQPIVTHPIDNPVDLPGYETPGFNPAPMPIGNKLPQKPTFGIFPIGGGVILPHQRPVIEEGSIF